MNEFDKATLLKNFNTALDKICNTKNISKDGKLIPVIFLESINKELFEDIGKCMVQSIKKKSKKSFKSSRNEYIVVKPDLRDPTRTRESLQQINSYADYSTYYTGLVVLDISHVKEYLQFGVDQQIEELLDGCKKQAEHSSLLFLSTYLEDMNLKDLFKRQFGERLIIVEIKMKQCKKLNVKGERHEKRATRH